MVNIVSNINTLFIVIHIDTQRKTELIWLIALSIATSNGNSILFPFCSVSNVSSSNDLF
jgi:hypothetical protein